MSLLKTNTVFQQICYHYANFFRRGVPYLSHSLDENFFKEILKRIYTLKLVKINPICKGKAQIKRIHKNNIKSENSTITQVAHHLNHEGMCFSKYLCVNFPSQSRGPLHVWLVNQDGIQLIFLPSPENYSIFYQMYFSFCFAVIPDKLACLLEKGNKLIERVKDKYLWP